MTTIPAILRMGALPDGSNEPIIIFPTIPGTNDPATCTFYAHIGQHGEGDFKTMLDYPHPKIEQEKIDAFDLMIEVTNIYVKPDSECIGIHYINNPTSEQESEWRMMRVKEINRNN